MKKELQYFLTAVMFYTRIPCPNWIDHSEDALNKSTKYFTSIGWIVGGISALMCWITVEIFPIEIAVLLSICGSLLLTGAFHEDGFADMCDGFGGGWTKEKILEIMKDSRMGAYGTIGLIMILSLKWICLVKLGSNAPFGLLVAHILSRWTATTVIFRYEYARLDESSKSKPIAKKMPLFDYIFSTFIAFLSVLLFLPDYYIFILIIFAIEASRIYWANYFSKFLGGYTGDCLGALQQINEIVIYLLLLSIPILYEKISIFFL
ncbi:MAG: adenosylcobinamide-GDP ribazoletransferase [Bacteroidetes bacterium]|nr:MAG: adenosylcobinamide-GDP ribazoletransferase [Bacteroidota bacterium]TAG85518.1 MAG: adenosylcobinamide-GDP ribazoletransferase [Bacteroidota bacterium]